MICVSRRTLAILFFLCIGNNLLYGSNNLVERQEKRSMTTSVIVPCVARHFFWLAGLLESYQNQTVVPDEVVISLSEVENLKSIEISKLENGLWNFKLKILRHNGTIIDGENRTIAMDNSSGEILIFSDADDIPHPQRVEIAKYIFENYEVDHILHCWSLYRKDIQKLDIASLPILKFAEFRDISVSYLTTGSPCFLRKVGNAIKWHAIQDVAHANTVYSLFKNNIVIPIPLILYRNNLSSHAYKRLKNLSKLPVVA